MSAIIEACQGDGCLANLAQVSLVASDKPEAAGLEVARQNGITAHAIDRKAFDTRTAFEADLHQMLVTHQIDLVCLAGFMRVLSADFVQKWAGKLINIHPSLLPAFKGLDTHKRALEAGVTQHGCTVHYVNAEIDSGAIIDQTAVPVLPEDTPETLSERVLEAEHKLYSQSIYKIIFKK